MAMAINDDSVPGVSASIDGPESDANVIQEITIEPDDVIFIEEVPGKPRSKMTSRFHFCPWCSNKLQMKENKNGVWSRKCYTCPYAFHFKNDVYVNIAHRFQDEDDECQIVEAAAKNDLRQRTEVFCPKCNHNEAFFHQMQTRSADEPMTVYYECINKSCGHKWND